MKITKRRVREYNLASLIEEGGLSVKDALELQAIARRLHRYDELECEYGMSRRQALRCRNLEYDIEQIATTYGLQATHQGDPRGWPITLSTPAGKETQVCPH